MGSLNAKSNLLQKAFQWTPLVDVIRLSDNDDLSNKIYRQNQEISNSGPTAIKGTPLELRKFAFQKPIKIFSTFINISGAYI